MAEKVASLYAELGLESGKFTQGLKASEGSLKKFGGGLNDIVKGVTGFNLAQIGMAGAIVGGVNAAKKAIDEYSNYVETVDKMSMSTGMATDEISRLVQVADDFRVDMGSMEGALKMALQNGFNPTTDALANLADEINAIQDPTQKAARLQEIFGKQWQNIIPLLDRGGAAIREASQNISDGLVVTEGAVEANREYQKAADDLSDAWSAFANTASAEVLPALTSIINVLNDAIAASQENQGTLAGITGGYGRAAFEAEKAGKAMLYNADGERAAAAGAYYLEQAQAALLPALVDNNTELRYMAGHLDDAAATAEEMAQASKDLASATDQLKTTQQNWKEGAAGDVAGLLDESKLGAYGYEEALGALDEVQGTNLLTAEKLRDKQEELTSQLNDGVISLDEFKQGLEDMNAQFMPLDESVKESTELVDTLLKKLAELDSTWTAEVRVNVSEAYSAISANGSTIPTTNKNGSGNSNGYTGATNTNPGVYGYNDYIRRANGGMLYAGQPAIVGERGPEMFVPSTTGSIVPNNQLSSPPVQVFMTINDITDWEQAAYRITQIQRRRG